MDRVHQIEAEINQLENRLKWLKNELTNIQNVCSHEFKDSPFTKQCLKCHLIESLYW